MLAGRTLALHGTRFILRARFATTADHGSPSQTRRHRPRRNCRRYYYYVAQPSSEGSARHVFVPSPGPRQFREGLKTCFQCFTRFLYKSCRQIRALSSVEILKVRCNGFPHSLDEYKKKRCMV